MLATLLTLLFILALAALGWWAVDKVGVSDPFNWILKLVIALVALIAAANNLGIT